VKGRTVICCRKSGYISIVFLTLIASQSFAQNVLPTIEIGKKQLRSTVSRQSARPMTRPAQAQSAQTPLVIESAPGDAGSPYAALSPSQTAQLTQQSGDRYSGYDAQKSVADKIDAPIIQTPISVKTVTREIIDDQPYFNINDVIVSNVSAVAMQPTGCSNTQNMYIRGFATGSNQIAQVYRNGLLDPNEFCPSTANMQAVEVVKGPTSVLYGRSEPGGLIDFVTRKPLETAYYSVTQQGGEFGTSRTFIDATGPLNADKSLLYRFDSEATREGSFVNYVWTQRYFASGVITYHPIEQFTANLRAEYQDTKNIDNQPNFPAYGNKPASIPINTYLEDISFTGSNPDHSLKRYVNFDWTYDFNKDWNLTQRFAYNNSRNMTSNNFFACLVNPPYPDQSGGACPSTLPPGTGWNQFLWAPDTARSITGNLELKGKFATGFFNHSGLMGTDHVDFTNVTNGLYGYVPTQINIFAPMYGNGGLQYSQLNPLSGYLGSGANPPCYGGAPDYNNQYGYQCNTLALIKKQAWQGFYGQDMISFADDKLHVLLGGRYDIASASTGTGFGSLFPYSNDTLTLANLPGQPPFGRYGVTKLNFFSPRVGVVFQALPTFSIYGNFTKSYGLNNGLNEATMTPLPSQMAIQWEAGAKAEFFDKMLTATAAFFNIDKTNIATPNPSDPTGATYDLLSARSHGAELDITGRIDRNWSLIANYAHVDVRVMKGSPWNPNDPQNLVGDIPMAGKRSPGVPDNTGNLWVKYDADGDFRGLTSGIGLSRVGTAAGDYANSYYLPAYTLVKLMGGYRFQMGKSWITTQIFVDNLTDSRYFFTSSNYSNRYSMMPGAPRSALGSVRVEW
jgi:iron complex outermembrane recepter protein